MVGLRSEEEGKVGRTRATTDEWRRYYDRAARARARFGDPFERHIRRRRLLSRVSYLCVILTCLGVTAALSSLVFSLLGDP